MSLYILNILRKLENYSQFPRFLDNSIYLCVLQQ